MAEILFSSYKVARFVISLERESVCTCCEEILLIMKLIVDNKSLISNFENHRMF